MKVSNGPLLAGALVAALVLLTACGVGAAEPLVRPMA
jgi:hypothetical protein